MSEVLERVTIAGRPLVCTICQGDTFVHRQLKLITSGLANSGFNKTGEAAVCATCRYVHTFLGAELTWTRLDRPEAQG